MERTIRYVGISLIVISTIWMGCSMTKVKPTTITKHNVCLLKGTWEGSTSFGGVANKIQAPTTMEIYNDTVPLRGKLTIRNAPPALPNPSAAKPNTGDVTIEFRDGNINESGNFVGKQGEKRFELTLIIGQKLKMDGWIYYASLNPSVTLSR